MPARLRHSGGVCIRHVWGDQRGWGFGGSGYAVLPKTAIFNYQADNYYNRESEGGIRYNDPALNINWQLPEADIQVSEKDAGLPLLSEVSCFQY